MNDSLLQKMLPANFLRKFWLLMMLQLVALAAIAQEQTLTGKVADETGEVLPGVSVLVKGTTIGTVTDIEGEFKLNVPETAETILFSYVGFQSIERQIRGQTNFGITLIEDSKQLDEIVVTALGVERETKALGYSVQEVQGAELTQAREANVVNSLAGRVAGVQVTGGNSGVGSTSMITIRGESSLIPGNNSPLFVVDGIPISNNTTSNSSEGNMETDYGNGAADINPDDIESISVLKGANATALYGSRGANGVIIIQTKTGKGQKGIGVSVNSNVTFENPLRIPQYQNSYGQGAGGEFEFGDGFGGGVNDNIDESWGPKLDVRDPSTPSGWIEIKQHDSPTANGFRGGDSHPSIDRGAITPTPWISHPDNIEDFFETGVTTTNNVALSSSNDQASFRLSYTDLRNTGILPNTDLNRNTLAFSTEYKLTDWFKASASINYVDSRSNNRPNNSYGTENPMYLWVWFGRQIDMNSLENYWQPGLEGVQQYNYNYNWHDNPYFTMHENTNAFDRDRLFGNLRLDFDLTKDLKLLMRAGTDFYNELRVGKRAFSTQRFARGQYREDKIFFEERNYDFLFTYNKELSTNWNLTASFGGNRRENLNKYNRISANELNVPNVYNFENSRIPLAKTQFNSEKRVNSLYGFANLAYKNMVFLDITGRNDWSSSLPNGQWSYFYPSVSLSGVVSDMVTFPDFISFFKLRAGWAQVGNDTDPYQLVGGYNFLEPFGGVPRVSESSTLKNNKLKPEEASSIELGTDIRFFNGRLGIDFTYYKSNTKNQILQVPLDITSGYNAGVINAGEIENQGIEAMLNVAAIQSNSGLNWNIGVNYTRNRGKVLSLTDELKTYQISSNYVQVLAKVGERMGDVYGTGFQTVQEGEFEGQVIHDENGFAKRDNTLKNLGNYNPDFMLGLNNSFKYKGFNFDFLFDYRHGGVVNSRTVLIGGTSGMMDFTAVGREEGIISEGVIQNEDGSFKQNDVRISGRDYYWWRYNRGNEEVGMYDATFLKLREVKFGYTFRTPILGGVINNLSLAIVGRNLALWTENPHFDPETLSFNGGTIVPGVEDMATPSSRSIGFNLSFKL
ncbi:MAG: SusC/RagA family TonB-linked outer membrane protein [Flammeovirgaceae bacterium]|nr:SusC/RagA family TonB-linked outer membrane protein [Flammeovirgaceae bacterium]